MASVYFRDSMGYIRQIGDAADWSGCCKVIKQFLDTHNYHSYYQRFYSPQKNNIIVDVGSWSESFEIRGIDIKEALSC